MCVVRFPIEKILLNRYTYIFNFRMLWRACRSLHFRVEGYDAAGEHDRMTVVVDAA